MTHPMPMRHLLTSLSLAGIALLTACAPATRVTLLPQANGRASAVEVTTGKGTQRIDQPYQVAEVGRSGDLSQDTTTADAVRERHPRLLALQPPAPERFTLEFEPGTSLLTPDSLNRLETVIRSAQSRAGGEIVVTGHTDRQGAAEANDALSLQRAQAVRSLLIERGFSAGLIDAVGRGEREPVVPTEDEVVEPRNRRAEVEVR